MTKTPPVPTPEAPRPPASSAAQVLYTDLDGTMLGPTGNLFWTAERAPTLAAAAALVRAEESGLEVVAVTGRSRRSTFELARLIGLRTWFCELGGVRVYERGKEVVPMAPRRAGEPIIEAIAPALAALESLFPGQLEAHEPWNEGREATLILRGAGWVGAAAEEWLTANGYDWLTMIDNGVGHRSFPGLAGVDPVHFFHLAPRGVSKQAAIAADQSRRGLDPSACAMVGDSRSELACVSVVGRCFLVRNALLGDPDIAAEAAASGAEVTGRGYTEGFAEVVDLLLSG
ncbi:MAG: HAD family phosphatase [Acidimicrobiia bacterium]